MYKLFFKAYSKKYENNSAVSQSKICYKYDRNVFTVVITNYC